MSKIYEALQRAEAARPNSRLSIVPIPSLPHSPPANAPAEALAPTPEHPLDVGFEREIATMFHPIVSALPDSRGVIMFVAPHANAGTSMVARNFGAYSALSGGYRTLLLDADRDAPQQAARLGLRPGRDIEGVLMDERPLEEAIYPVGNTGLSVATLCYPGTDRLRGSYARTARICETLRSMYELVIVDCPSAGTTPESMMLCSQVDGIVMVVDAKATSQPQARRAKEMIEGGGGKFVGMIFNKRQFYIPNWIYRRL